MAVELAVLQAPELRIFVSLNQRIRMAFSQQLLAWAAAQARVVARVGIAAAGVDAEVLL